MHLLSSTPEIKIRGENTGLLRIEIAETITKYQTFSKVPTIVYCAKYLIAHAFTTTTSQSDLLLVFSPHTEHLWLQD